MDIDQLKVFDNIDPELMEKHNALVDVVKDLKDEVKILKGKKSKKFIPPTKEEVEVYVKEKCYNVDVDKFMNFYISKGWKIGINPMVSWRGALGTWNTKPREEKKW